MTWSPHETIRERKNQRKLPPRGLASEHGREVLRHPAVQNAALRGKINTIWELGVANAIDYNPITSLSRRDLPNSRNPDFGGRLWKFLTRVSLKPEL